MEIEKSFTARHRRRKATPIGMAFVVLALVGKAGDSTAAEKPQVLIVEQFLHVPKGVHDVVPDRKSVV